MMTLYRHAYVLDVMSDDHPGIIAGVGGAVRDLRGNIDACSQTVLAGYFTLIMIVSFPEPLEADDLARKVAAQEARGSHLQVMARPFLGKGRGASESDTDRFVVTAFGRDKPGIVLRFSQYLASKDINIVDLYGDRAGDDFVLISQVEIPRRWDLAMLQADLEEMGRQEGFTARVQHEDIFVATNQLRLRRAPSG